MIVNKFCAAVYAILTGHAFREVMPAAALRALDMHLTLDAACYFV